MYLWTMAVKELLRTPQSSSITGAWASDCLLSYLGHLFAFWSYSATEMQPVNSTAPADRATKAQGYRVLN